MDLDESPKSNSVNSIFVYNLYVYMYHYHIILKGHDDLCWILHGDVGLQSTEPDQGDDGVPQCWEQTASQGLLSFQPHVDQ